MYLNNSVKLFVFIKFSYKINYLFFPISTIELVLQCKIFLILIFLLYIMIDRLKKLYCVNFSILFMIIVFHFYKLMLMQFLLQSIYQLFLIFFFYYSKFKYFIRDSNKLNNFKNQCEWLLYVFYLKLFKTIRIRTITLYYIKVKNYCVKTK